MSGALQTTPIGKLSAITHLVLAFGKSVNSLGFKWWAVRHLSSSKQRLRASSRKRIRSTWSVMLRVVLPQPPAQLRSSKHSPVSAWLHRSAPSPQWSVSRRGSWLSKQTKKIPNQLSLYQLKRKSQLLRRSQLLRSTMGTTETWLSNIKNCLLIF